MEEIKREYLSTECSPIIDPELRDLLPPITDEEREAMAADIMKNGCYSPMICMDDMTLVDGHHRYDICTEHDIPYRMVVLDFEDKLAAMEWMIDTQKGRRNLTKYQLGQIALKLRDKIEAKAKKKQSDAGGDKKSDDAKSLWAWMCWTRSRISSSCCMSQPLRNFKLCDAKQKMIKHNLRGRFRASFLFQRYGGNENGSSDQQRNQGLPRIHVLWLVPAPMHLFPAGGSGRSGRVLRRA